MIFGHPMKQTLLREGIQNIEQQVSHSIQILVNIILYLTISTKKNQTHITTDT